MSNILIEKTQETLHKFEAKSGLISIDVINGYQDYLKNLLELYERAKGDKNMNVKEELYSAFEKVCLSHLLGSIKKLWQLGRCVFEITYFHFRRSYIQAL